MKVRLVFGENEPPREMKWWQPIRSFPSLVLFKGKKWEFFSYDTDKTNQVEYICFFSEVASYDPNWYATTYEKIDGWFDNSSCECGAIYTSFPQFHMFFCPKWSRW